MRSRFAVAFPATVHQPGAGHTRNAPPSYLRTNAEREQASLGEGGQAPLVWELKKIASASALGPALYRVFSYLFSVAACVESLQPSRGFFEPQHDVCVHGASRCLIWTNRKLSHVSAAVHLCLVSLKSASFMSWLLFQIDVLRDPHVLQNLDERARCGRSSSITPLAPNTTTPFPSTSTQPFPNTTTTERATRRALAPPCAGMGPAAAMFRSMVLTTAVRPAQLSISTVGSPLGFSGRCISLGRRNCRPGRLQPQGQQPHRDLDFENTPTPTPQGGCPRVGTPY